MKDFFKAFSELKAQLENNKLIGVTEFIMDEGLDSYDLEMTEDEFGVKMPDDVKEFYKTIAMVNFLWVLKEDSGIELLPHDQAGNVNGKVNILDFYTMVSGKQGDAAEPWKDTLWFDGIADSHERIRDLRPFDFFDNHNGECVGFLRSELDKGNTALYLRDDRSSIVPADMTIEEYVDYVIKCKGFVKCQQAFVYKGSDEERMNYYLPKIFGA